jgi:hypothetical protein
MQATVSNGLIQRERRIGRRPVIEYNGSTRLHVPHIHPETGKGLEIGHGILGIPVLLVQIKDPKRPAPAPPPTAKQPVQEILIIFDSSNNQLCPSG